MTPHSFSVSTHLGRRASRTPRQHDERAAVRDAGDPGARVSSSSTVSTASEDSWAAVLARAAGSTSDRPDSAWATAASCTSEAANVVVDGPCSVPARVSSRRSARSASAFEPVRHRQHHGPLGSILERVERRTTSALRPDLTITRTVAADRTWVRKCRSSAVSICSARTPWTASSFTAG